jgi:hypothetical protein
LPAPVELVLGTLRFGPLPALLPVLRDFVLARVSTPSSMVGITAQTHLVALISLPVLPVIPIVEAKAALPWVWPRANCAPSSDDLGRSHRGLVRALRVEGCGSDEKSWTGDRRGGESRQLQDGASQSGGSTTKPFREGNAVECGLIVIPTAGQRDPMSVE